jgi:hypothetical protein
VSDLDPFHDVPVRKRMTRSLASASVGLLVLLLVAGFGAVMLVTAPLWSLAVPSATEDPADPGAE